MRLTELDELWRITFNDDEDEDENLSLNFKHERQRPSKF